MKSNHLFLITGALQSNNTKHNVSERASQTIATLKSVKKTAPNVPIIYIDAGLKLERNLAVLVKVARIRMLTTRYLDLSNDPEIKLLQDAFKSPVAASEDLIGFMGLYKSLLEVVSYQRAITYIQNSKYKKFNKITKLSGRYELNSNFSYELHLEKLQSSDFVTSFRKESYLKHLVEITHFYHSVLWSGDFEKIKEMVLAVKKELTAAARMGIVMDLEHAMFSCLQEYDVCEIETLGVFGSPSMPGGKFEC